jgi:cell division protein FtsB
MNLDDLLHDIHLLEDELRAYERKYNVLSETFYEAYQNGEEPPDDAWVLEWTAWASAYKLLQRRREQYQIAIEKLRQESDSIADMIARTARHEPILLPQ